MIKRVLVVASLAGAVLVAGASGARAAGRTTKPAAFQAYSPYYEVVFLSSEWNPDDPPSTGGHYGYDTCSEYLHDRGIAGDSGWTCTQVSCDTNTTIAGTGYCADPSELISSRRHAGYLTNTIKGDVLFFQEVTDLPTNIGQRAIFGQSSKNHVAVCSDGGGTSCTSTRHMDAYPKITDADIVAGKGLTSSCGVLSHLKPGVSSAEPGVYQHTAIAGQRLRPIASALVRSIKNNIISYVRVGSTAYGSAASNDDYQLGGYTIFTPVASGGRGGCSEFFADQALLTTAEGYRYTVRSVSEVQTAANTLMASQYDSCMNKAEVWGDPIKMIGWLLGVVQSTCHGVTYQTVNALMNQCSMDNAYPTYGHGIVSVSAPQDEYANLTSLGDGNQVVWTGLAGTAVSGADLQRTSTSTGSWDAGAYSNISIPTTNGGGFVNVQYDGVTTVSKAIGLSNGSSNSSAGDIDYAFVFSSSGVQIQEKGVVKLGYFAAVAGDTFRISVAGTTVKYWHNDVLKYTSTAAPIYPLLVDASFLHKGAIFRGVVISQTP